MKFPHQLPQPQDEHNGPRANPQGKEVDGAAVGQRVAQTQQDLLVTIALVMQAQKIGCLPDHDEHAGARHESNHHRFGNITGQVPQLEDGNQDLNDADHDREQKHRLESVEPRVGIKKGERTKDDQRDGIGRAVDQVRRRPEQGCHRRDHDGRVESETRINPGNQGISHGLRQGDGRHGEPGQDVLPGNGPIILDAHGRVALGL